MQAAQYLMGSALLYSYSACGRRDSSNMQIRGNRGRPSWLHLRRHEKLVQLL